MSVEPDILARDEGTIWLLTPATERAKQWVVENFSDEIPTWGDGDIVVEHRFVRDIVEGAMGDGLSVALAR